MIADDVTIGSLYKFNDLYGEDEELLWCVSVIRDHVFCIIKWLWLTGPDAGTMFIGQPVVLNQVMGVELVVEVS